VGELSETTNLRKKKEKQFQRRGGGENPEKERFNKHNKTENKEEEKNQEEKNQEGTKGEGEEVKGGDHDVEVNYMISIKSDKMRVDDV
jgi:hypothetical protein